MEKRSNWFASLLSYAGVQKKKFILSVVLSCISIVSGLLPFFCVYKVILLLCTDALTASEAAKWCLIALLFFSIKEIFFTFSTGLSHQVAYYVVEGLRLKIADKFLKAPLGEVQKYSIGQIKSIMIDKVESLEPPLAHMVPEGAGHMLLPVVSLIALCLIDRRLMLSALITLPGAVICMGLTFKISGENFQKYNDSNSYMNSTIVEYIEGIEVIKAFGRAGVSYEKYSHAINDFKYFVVKWMRSTWITMKLAFALFPSTLMGTLPVGLYLAYKGSITSAEAALGVMLSMSMVTSLARLEVFSESIRQMQETVEELEKYLTMKPLPEPSEKADIESYDIKLSDIHFSYDGKKENEVIKGIDLDIPQGKFTALAGPSGSGKSTIAKLIARFYDIDKGSITIGGKDIREIPLSQLSSLISFVTQDNFLFKCSLLENIRMGNPNATDEEVKEAARNACCEEFINKLPQGYDTMAGEAGKKLSGGEKQRIAIARMMLKNSPIVILDEATAFTDPENEDKLQESIAHLTKGKTLLVIAHRLSTIKMADNIAVTENGKVIAQGTQEELLASCPLYNDMWKAHIGSKEWAVSSKERRA